MEATDWEFRHRAVIFGAIIGCGFALYALDPPNSTASLANWLAARSMLDANAIAHLLFACAALVLALAALMRTWASAFLNARVVYAADVKSTHLVADGPYRHTRNPLYLANVLMASSLGAMMSRTGSVLAVAAMLTFCYRLIRREEAGMHSSQAENYASYCRSVPRLWPALRSRIAGSANRADWRTGLRAEAWYWGFAVALAAFAVTFNFKLFLALLTLSVATFWVSSSSGAAHRD
jgi:protein-S-isoprenylcysteine O-methyltransferase Ste14